jgi:hypothetical protein
MTDMRDDHIVDFLHEETIENYALAWLREAGILHRPYFNIVKFVNDFLMKRLKKGPFKIVLFDAGPNEKPAYISFNPLTLNIDREIWRDADIGEPFARFVVAHEVGHLIFHDAFAQAFSNDSTVRIKSFPKEYSAEWQANTFAYHFLMPTHIVAAYDDLDTLISICGVTREVAIERSKLTRATKPPLQTFEGDPCTTCGNFALLRIGTTVTCTICRTRRSEARTA